MKINVTQMNKAIDINWQTSTSPTPSSVRTADSYRPSSDAASLRALI